MSLGFLQILVDFQSTSIDLLLFSIGFSQFNLFQSVSISFICRNVLLYIFWRILPGIFLEDFSGHFLPQK